MNEKDFEQRVLHTLRRRLWMYQEYAAHCRYKGEIEESLEWGCAEKAVELIAKELFGDDVDLGRVYPE